MDFEFEIRKAAEHVALQKIAGGRTGWINNPEIRGFIISQFGLGTTAQIFQAALEKFGSSTPSRSAIGRFYKAVREDVNKEVHTA